MNDKLNKYEYVPSFIESEDLDKMFDDKTTSRLLSSTKYLNRLLGKDLSGLLASKEDLDKLFKEEFF